MKKIACIGLMVVTMQSVYAGGFTYEPNASDVPDQILTDAAPDWTGFYLGINGGYGWRGIHSDFNPRPGSSAPFMKASKGFEIGGGVYGAQFGYDYQVGMNYDYIVGFETDFDGSTIGGTAHQTGTYSGTTVSSAFVTTEKVNWFGTLRPLVGFLIEDGEWMMFGTAGVVYSNITDTGNTNFSPADGHIYPVSATQTILGWTAGGGGEYKFSRHGSAAVEYLFCDYGNIDATGVALPNNNGLAVGYHWENIANVLRINLNYRFV